MSTPRTLFWTLISLVAVSGLMPAPLEAQPMRLSPGNAVALDVTADRCPGPNERAVLRIDFEQGSLPAGATIAVAAGAGDRMIGQLSPYSMTQTQQRSGSRVALPRDLAVCRGGQPVPMTVRLTLSARAGVKLESTAGASVRGVKVEIIGVSE